MLTRGRKLRRRGGEEERREGGAAGGRGGGGRRGAETNQAPMKLLYTRDPTLLLTTLGLCRFLPFPLLPLPPGLPPSFFPVDWREWKDRRRRSFVESEGGEGREQMHNAPIFFLFSFSSSSLHFPPHYFYGIPNASESQLSCPSSVVPPRSIFASRRSNGGGEKGATDRPTVAFAGVQGGGGEGGRRFLMGG